MHQVAAGVWQLTGFPRHYLNAYLAEDVLIDAGTRWRRGRMLAELSGRRVTLVALTHCHPDHQGTAAAVCRAFGVPLACHEADVAAAEGRTSMQPGNTIVRLGVRILGGPPYPVARVLREGDVVGGFRVVHTPGHTPGHVCFFRDSDRVAIAGDLLANLHVLTGRAGLRQPPRAFSIDAAQNRNSIRRLAELRPALVCFGHGPPLREPVRLLEYAARLRD
jgi:glyoxylase-like metal-dependent hydrolase (beta-lactamase superfamily II)